MATAEVATHGDTSNNDDVTVPVMEEKTTEEAIEEAIYEDPDLVEVIHKLNQDVSIEPDRDLNIGETNSQTQDSDSVSTSSSHRDIDENECSSPESSSSVKNGKPTKESESAMSSTNHTNGKTSSEGSLFNRKTHRRSIDSTASRESNVSNGRNSSSGSKKSSGSSIKNPLKALKKLTKFDKSESKRRNSTSYRSEFTAVIVDKLPQVFVAKYMGSRPVSGLSGLHVVRRPVDEMVKEVKDKLDKEEQTELPLLYVVISAKGIDLREHKKNRIKDQAPLGIMPIDYISYGVQDIKYWRVFCCIEVKQLSSRTPKVATCHAFLCDSSHNGRKMALSIGAAFSVHAKKLKTAGKTHNFQVELRPPDELADALEDCEA